MVATTLSGKLTRKKLINKEQHDPHNTRNQSGIVNAMNNTGSKNIITGYNTKIGRNTNLNIGTTNTNANANYSINANQSQANKLSIQTKLYPNPKNEIKKLNLEKIHTSDKNDDYKFITSSVDNRDGKKSLHYDLGLKIMDNKNYSVSPSKNSKNPPTYSNRISNKEEKGRSGTSIGTWAGR